MTTPIVLTKHQTDAATDALDRLESGAPVTAIRGLAGTGKTTLIPTLREMLDAQGDDSYVGTPTHKAAVVLKRKGIQDAKTIHSLALAPYFKADYWRLMTWLGEPVECKDYEQTRMTPDIGGVPFLAYRELERRGESAAALMKRAEAYGAMKAATSIGIHGQRFFDEWGPRRGKGVLIIDEGSMVGEDSLNKCMEAFQRVIVVGDPGQLPPVKDKAILDTLPGVQLTEIHRQAKDSPIITLAYAAREGSVNWRGNLNAAGAIDTVRRLPAELFLASPLLVWRNVEDRLKATLMIREALGYGNALQVGEPLCCKASDKASRAAGFVNNSHWRIVEVSSTHPRRCTIQEEDSDKTYDVLLHMEEYDGTDIDPEAVQFRFGYAITVHTSQGSEWPNVYVCQQSLMAKQRSRYTKQDPDEFRQWSYTAITRAKQELGFLTQYNFSPLMAVPVTTKEEVAMPVKMQEDTTSETRKTPEPISEDPREADIPDPQVPAAVITVPLQQLAPANSTSVVSPIPENLLPLANGFCDYLQGRMHEWLLREHHSIMDGVNTSLMSIREWAKEIFGAMADKVAANAETNEHAQYQLANTIEMLQQGGLPIMTPYQVVLRVRTPQGIPMALTITKPTAALLVDELERLNGWMQTNGYTPDESIAGAAA